MNRLQTFLVLSFVAVVYGFQQASGGASLAQSMTKMLGIPHGILTESQGPVFDVNGTQLPPLTTVYLFDQLIDHKNPSKGTFQQRYWAIGSSTSLVFIPLYLMNFSINGMIAQQEHGAAVLIEHRFFGESNPYNNLTAASLEFLTIEQAIEDLVYFAENVKLPIPCGDAISPKQAPWILVGGSYAGALTAWTKVRSPNTFWAAYASSAVVEAITDFWAYFQPVLEYMPANCSADVQAVITHLDGIWLGNNQTAINATKDMFGLSAIPYLDDVANALRYPLFLWQGMQPTFGYNFFDYFCDTLEVKNGKNAPATGWGLDHALLAWGNFTKNLCPVGQELACWDSHNSSSFIYSDIQVGQDYRSWNWMVCNEVGWYQMSAPVGKPSLISRVLQPNYEERLCTYYFPDKFSSYPTPTVAATNFKYAGWNVHEPRLFFANGHRDPWREATVSAENQTIPSTKLQPIAISDGFHCSDLLIFTADASVQAVQAQGLAAIHAWLQEWRPY